MRITFILPFVSLTGGVKVVGQYANCLTDRGHQVTVIYPLVPPRYGEPWYNWKALHDQVMQSLGNIRKGVRISWFDLKASLRRPLTLHMHSIPDADIVVATAWPTSYYVNSYPTVKGKKFYLIQHYEVWGSEKRLVDRTWVLPLKKVVIASWLKELAEKQFRESVIGPIINGIDHGRFYGSPRQPSLPKRVGIMWHQADWKGCPDGVKAFEMARQAMPDLQLVAFATKRYPDMPDYAEFHERPPVDTIRQIYNSCDVFISPSWAEGSQAPPMEAMACGCAVIATDVGGIPDYAIAGETVIAVPPRRPDLMGQALIDMLQDDEKRRRIALAGQEHIRQFTWERATDQLEQAFKQALQTD